MRYIKDILIICFLGFTFNCFTQEQSKLYKVVNIDSTENNYIIFLSSDTCEIESNIDTPFLVEEGDNYYSLSKYDKTNIYCLLSPKIKGLNRNIFLNKTYKLSINRFANKTMNAAYDHIGYGDFLFLYPNEYFCVSKEIASLSYTQDIDSIKYFSFLLQQNELFDGCMLKMWMNFSHSKLSYSQWLQEKINSATDIFFDNCADTIVLYRDEKCKMPYINVKSMDYCEDNVLKAKLFYQYKKNCFIQIGNELNSIYGWIRNRDISQKNNFQKKKKLKN